MRWRQARVVEVVEQPQLFAQQEGAVERAVGLLDLIQRRELADRLALGGLQKRPAGALDPAAGRGVRALVGVPLVAADLVGRAAREAADVERVKADLGVGDRVADGALVLAAHVDRDRPDRVAAVAEVVEELGQGGAVAARPAPHDRARAVVGDRGQVALPAAVTDLVDTDPDQALEAALVEMLDGHARDDPPDRVPADPEQAADRGTGHLLRQPRDHVLEVARVPRARARPRHRLHPHAAVAATQQPQLALDDAAARAEIKVSPAFDASIVDLQAPARLAAARAHPPTTSQPDRDDHPLGGEADVEHGRSGQAEQPLECGGDAHVALLRGPLTFEQPAACCEGGGASLAFRATSATFPSRRTPLRSAPNAAPQAATSPTRREETHKTSQSLGRAVRPPVPAVRETEARVA